MASRRQLLQEIKRSDKERRLCHTDRLTEEQWQLVAAVRSRNLEKFKHILYSGTNPNFVDDTGNSLLHMVVGLRPSKDLSEIIELLVYFGVNLDERDRFGRTPLHIAVTSSANIVKLLLNAGSSVDAQDNAGQTPLIQACGNASDEAAQIVQCLRDRPCNVRLQDQDGCTALHYVCKNSKQRMEIRNTIALELLNTGLSATVADKSGKMAICYELDKFVNSRRKQFELTLVQTLIRAGAGFNRKNKQHEKWIKYVMNFSRRQFLERLLQITEPLMPVSSVKKIRSCSDTIIEDEDVLCLRKQLLKLSCRVQSLKVMSCITIRESLRGKVLVRVDSLPLPPVLKNYILLNDC
ncbi:hypothetical protein ScPMuIL_009816 [Solemya velum]